MSIYAPQNSHVAKRRAKIDVLSITRDFQKCKLRNRPVIHNLGESQVTDDVFYEDHKPIFTVLRIMGVMPLQRTEIGNIINREWAKKCVMITE
jgi:hypothetical protein